MLRHEPDEAAEVILRTGTNGQAIAERWRRRAEGFAQQRRATQDRIRSVILEESLRILAAKIYQPPIPRRPKSRKPAWTRKGDLARAEGAEIRGGVVYLRNTSDHARARRDLGTPQGRPIRSPGVQRVDWQHEALTNRLSEIRGFYREMNGRVIDGR